MTGVQTCALPIWPTLLLCSLAASGSARRSKDAAALSRSVGSQDRFMARLRRGGYIRPGLAFSNHDATHAIAAASAVVGIEAITKSFLYFAHERLWEAQALSRRRVNGAHAHHFQSVGA